MLEIYKGLFDDLNKNNIQYVIYKGLNHLSEDLNGERKDGDIDILIKDNKFIFTIEKYLKKGLENQNSAIGLDIETEKVVWIDFSNDIKIGDIPYKPYYFNIDINKLKIKKFENITILANEDYIPLMFVMRVTAKNDKKENLEELQDLLKNTNVDGYVKDIVENLTKIKWEKIEKDLLKAISWQELKDKYKKIILKNANIDKKALLAQKFKWMIDKYKAVQRKIFKTPSYRVRKKGCLVAFMGNDGAGKSSTIEAVLNIDYFKYTGIKMIYFGNNQYVIPFLNYFMRKTYENKFVKLFIGILGHIDKQYVRILMAKYYLNKGYIILADRYVYDELMGMEYNYKPTTNILKKIYRFIFKPRMFIKPEITFFLDVEPEVAYKRKQDYEFELVKQNIKRYREFLSKFDEVVRIDANQAHEKVISEVVKRLYEKDIEVNKKY